MDDDLKIISEEQNHLVLERGDRPLKIEKIFNKTRFTLYIRNSTDIEEMTKLSIEYLKPNATYGVYCKKQGMLEGEYLTSFKNFKNIISGNFSSIKFKRYKTLALNIQDVDEQTNVINSYHIGKT